MKLVLGAPVANRAWALPTWFRALAYQTVRPDRLVFVHGGHRGDRTWQGIEDGARRLGIRSVHVSHDGLRTHHRHDSERYHTLARCRNTMLALARTLEDPDVFVSLDTDVILDDPRTLERLVGLLEQGWDTASPITWLHPAGEGSWAFNAGRLAPGTPGDPRRQWVRCSKEEAESGDVIAIGVPMAAIAMNRRVIAGARYRHHESGEDLGFAHDLERLNARCAWDTSLKARHVWGPEHL